MVLIPKSSVKGFTLVELLITISIISILSAVGLVVFTSVMKQGRDTKRQSDLRSIQSALEQYYADNFSYPAQVSSGGSIAAGNKTYMREVPFDPVTGNPPYVYTPAGTIYCLYASLEKPSSPVPAPPTGCTYPSNRYNFALTSP